MLIRIGYELIVVIKIKVPGHYLGLLLLSTDGSRVKQCPCIVCHVYTSHSFPFSMSPSQKKTLTYTPNVLTFLVSHNLLHFGRHFFYLKLFYHNNNSHIFRELIWKQCRCIVLGYLIFVFQFLQQQKKSSSYLFDHQMYITWQPISEKINLHDSRLIPLGFPSLDSPLVMFIVSWRREGEWEILNIALVLL